MPPAEFRRAVSGRIDNIHLQVDFDTARTSCENLVDRVDSIDSSLAVQEAVSLGENRPVVA
jgi:hypothetical protein